MKAKHLVLAVAAVVVMGAGAAFADLTPRTPVEFFKGHWHDEHGQAQDAPAHSGGLDRNGCHNGSVPYHCH